MADFPYAESFQALRDEILSGLGVLKAKERKLRKRFGRLQSAEPEEAIRIRLQLRGIARKHFLSPDELFANPNRAADLQLGDITSIYLRPFAARACRLVLRAIDDENLDKTLAPKLWGAIAAAERLSSGDRAAAAFFDRVVLPVVITERTKASSKAVGVLSDLAAACDALTKVFPSKLAIRVKGLDEKDRAKAVETLEMATPKLVTDGVVWKSNKNAADISGVKTTTLGKYRREGICNVDMTFGRDRDGRIWRRHGTKGSHPWYLAETLKKK